MTDPPTLRRVLGPRDLVLFFVVTGFNLRWASAAAVGGPSVITMYVVACLLFYAPLVLAVLELSSRYPDEGGVYVWSKRAFGPFAGFLTGWAYWWSCIPYFPGILYFAAASLLYLAGPSMQHLVLAPGYFIAVSCVGLALATGFNVVGLQTGKWVNNIGAWATYLAVAILAVMAAVAWSRSGSAVAFTAHAVTPGFRLTDLVFFSTIAFSLSGIDSASLMGDEIHEPRRTLPRALVVGGGLVTVLYIVTTASELVALPPGKVTALQGVLEAIATVCRSSGVAWVIPIAAVAVVVSSLGQVNGWFGASARLPFVAGIDHLLPPVFGRLHPRWGTPYVTILTQGLIAAAVAVMGQAGTSVKGAYDVLTSMSVITYFIPYLFLFASLIAVQRDGASPKIGAPAAVVAGVLGFLTTAGSIGLAVLPASDEPNKLLAVEKVVGLSLGMVLLGAAVYAIGLMRYRRISRRISRAAL